MCFSRTDSEERCIFAGYRGIKLVQESQFYGLGFIFPWAYTDHSICCLHLKQTTEHGTWDSMTTQTGIIFATNIQNKYVQIKQAQVTIK